MSDEEDIRNTLARYCQLVDSGQFDAFADLFTEGARWVAPGAPILESREQLLEWITTTLTPFVGFYKHIVSNSVIEVDGDTAAARSYFMAYTRGADGPELSVMGEYVDAFRRDADRWRFVDHEIVIPSDWARGFAPIPDEFANARHPAP